MMRIKAIAFLLVLFAAVRLYSIGSDYESFDISFNENDSPIILLPINGELVPLMIDTGALGMGLSLDLDIISKLTDLKEMGVDRYIDFTGKQSEVKQYQLSSLRIGNLEYKNIIVNEYTKWGLYSKDSQNFHSKHPIKGVIAMQFLKQYPFILDYVNDKFVLLSHTSVTPSNIYNRTDWTKIRFGLNSDGLELSAVFGKNKFGKLDLDTGSTISIIKPYIVPFSEIRDDCMLKFEGQDKCRYFISENLMIDGQNFGAQPFILYKFEGPATVGILGSDFLDNKIIFFNFQDRYMQVKHNK